MIKPELLIKINADLKDFNSKMDQIKKKSGELSDSLSSIGVIAGVAFAGLTAVTFKTVSAYKEAKEASLKLEQTLKNQNVYSEKLVEQYKSMAKELQGLVSIDDDAIVSGLAILRRFTGQTEITKELTLATIDLAKASGIGLDEAFRKVGKAIGTDMNPLAREYGVVIDSNASKTEKMAQITEQLNRLVGGSAQVFAESKGPMEKLNVAFGNMQEAIGEKLSPMVNAFAEAMANLTEWIGENETAVKALAIIITGGMGFAGLTLLVVGATQAFIVLEATAVALGVTLTTLTGGLFAVVAGVGALVAIMATSKGKPKTLTDAQAEVDKLKAKIDDIKRRDPNGLALNNELYDLQRALKTAQKDVDVLKKKQDELKKPSDVASGKKTLEEIQAEIKAREELQKKKEEQIKKEEQERKQLAKDLIDAGKDEFTKLEDLRLRRIQIAKGDKALLLNIEKDYQEKRAKLQQETDQKMLELRQAQMEYEKKIREQNLREMQDASANPFEALSGFDSKTDQEKKNAVIGAGVGVATSVSRGAEGARALVVAGGKAVADAILPGLGQVAGPLLEAFSQGPEATRQMVQDFAKALPDIIEGLIEAIPVFIEEMANQTPIIIERLLEKLPEIIKSLVKSMPKVALALAMQMPKVALAFIKEIPNMIGSFISELVKGAGRFIEELISLLNPFGKKGVGGVISNIPIIGDVVGAVGDVIGGIGDFFGFAEGGQIFAKSVPSGFANDSYPAMLSSGELVVDRSTASGLRDFINRENSGNGSDVNTGLLSQILSAVTSPVVVETSVQVNQRTFADIILQLNRQNQRLA